MAVHPKRQSNTAARLVRFDPIWATHIVSWARDPQDAFWLAPKSAPPLKVGEILRWARPGHEQFMMILPEHPHPIGYGELNRLTARRREYWLGHLVVDPAYRGRGLGQRLTELLLQEAFTKRGARRVTLVVFPENVAAIRCYRMAGMIDDGFETHSFPAYGRTECLLRLSATAHTA